MKKLIVSTLAAFRIGLLILGLLLFLPAGTLVCWQAWGVVEGEKPRLLPSPLNVPFYPL